MATRPDGLDTSPRRPDELYLQLRKVAQDELATLETIESRIPRGNRRLDVRREFWAETFPAALDLTFEAVSNPVRSTLRELEEAVV
jgi:hypothetical protein